MLGLGGYSPCDPAIGLFSFVVVHMSLSRGAPPLYRLPFTFQAEIKWPLTWKLSINSWGHKWFSLFVHAVLLT